MCTDMKKIYSWMLAAVCVSALSVSCKQDALEPSTPDEGKTVKVEVSLAEELKGTMLDSKGIVWEVGDQIKYAGGAELTSSPLTAEDISSDGSVASFTFDAALTEVDRNGWFVSTNNNPRNNDEVDYTLAIENGNIYTQDVAGEMNHRRLFLHSGLGTMDVAKGQEKITVKMDVCGTIFRAMPYTTLYNSEKIESVTLSSNSYIAGTVAYERGAQNYKPIEGNGYEGTTVNYFKDSTVVVNLGTAFALDGVTSKETSKGIYFPVAASYEGYPYNGYKWVVSTDKARYVFDAMDKDFAVGENVVKNVYLNLDKATRSEHVAGTLRYEAVWKTVELAPSESKDNYCGYSVAMTKDGEEAEVKREGAEYYELYYKNVAFTCTDPDSGEPVDWVTVRYSTTNAHVLADVSENTGAERKALVTITYSDVRNYTIEESSKTKTFTITQKAAGAKTSVKAYGSWGENVVKEVELPSDGCVSVTSLNGGAVFGYAIVLVNGKEPHTFEEYNDAEGIFSKTNFVCVDAAAFESKDFSKSNIEWLSCDYLRNVEGKIQDRLWTITASANTSGSTRVGYIVYTFDNDPEYEYNYGVIAMKITQVASLNAIASFTNASSGNVSKDGGDVVTTLSLTIDGVVQSDVAQAISDYGLTLEASSTVESTSIASDGKVTLKVKANSTSVERKISLVLKYNSVVLASTEFTQEAGEGGAAKYTYTLVKNNGNASGAIWGMDTNKKNGADFTIKDIKLEGVSVSITEEIAEEVIAQAFACLSEKPDAGYDGYKTVDAGQIYLFAVNFNGSEMKVGVGTTEDSKGYITKLTWYDPDGTEGGHWFVFVP